MQDVEVIEDAHAAAAALDPVRARLLTELAVPASAAGLAAKVGLPRQKVNYHLKALEAHGLVVLAEERRHGGITERVLRAAEVDPVVAQDFMRVIGMVAPPARLLHPAFVMRVALARRARPARQDVSALTATGR